MTSTRLPGKILLPVLGKPLLQYQIERLKRVRLADELVIATTTNETDLPIVKLCDQLGVKSFRGSENDVLERYYLAAKSVQADVVVRVTSDCPLIDPAVVARGIDLFLKSYPNTDYVSNTLERTYPRGMDTEVFSFAALSTAYHEGTAPAEREHVTPFIYYRPERFCLNGFTLNQDYSGLRWTVDTPEDFELIRRMLEELYPNNPQFDLSDCLALIERHPELSEINAMIEQKKVCLSKS